MCTTNPTGSNDAAVSASPSAPHPSIMGRSEDDERQRHPVRRVWVFVVLTAPGLASAAGPDLRLVNAVATQNAPGVRALLDEGIDVNAARADGATALLWAAHWDDLATAARLLRAGAQVNAADDHGVTPLARACENGSVAMVETLLAAHADANAAQASGLTPLMTGARTGTVAVVEALLAHGADVNATTAETHSTAVMWAVAERHPAIVRVLLAHGANPQTSTTDGFTPLLYAARNGDVAMAEILLAAGVAINATGVDGTHPLPYAIITRQDAFARFLLERGADPNGSMGGIRALHAAAGSVAPWLGEWNRRHGDGRRRSDFGMRTLDPSRRLTLITQLLARGADPNARITTTAMFMSHIGYPRKGAFETFACGTGNLRGATPLWVAANASSGRGGGADQVETVVEILRTLLAAGADQHLATDDGTTPLMVAAGLGRESFSPREPRGRRSVTAEAAVTALLEAGADVNEADFTALHGAVFRGLNEVIVYLVEHGADINARDFRGRTPYRMAEGAKQSFQFQGWPETAELLKALGANPCLGIPGTVHERLRDVAAAAP